MTPSSGFGLALPLPCGHGANSQRGPLRTTALPSGHTFASCVHAVARSTGTRGGSEEDGELGPQATTVIDNVEAPRMVRGLTARAYRLRGVRRPKLGPTARDSICKTA